MYELRPVEHEECGFLSLSPVLRMCGVINRALFRPSLSCLLHCTMGKFGGCLKVPEMAIFSGFGSFLGGSKGPRRP